MKNTNGYVIQGIEIEGGYWDKYSRVSVEFDNQIVCKRK